MPCKRYVRRQPFLSLDFTLFLNKFTEKMTVIPYSNRISIRDFLAWRGIQPKYERNGYGMYLSPLREERTPSFKVDYVQNLWYDFGLGEGGTLLTLVMRLERSDGCKTVKKETRGLLLSHRVLVSLLALAGHCRSCVQPPFPRSASSPTLRSGIRHWSVISPHAVSSRRSPRHSAARSVTR